MIITDDDHIIHHATNNVSEYARSPEALALASLLQKEQESQSDADAVLSTVNMTNNKETLNVHFNPNLIPTATRKP